MTLPAGDLKKISQDMPRPTPLSDIFKPSLHAVQFTDDVDENKIFAHNLGDHDAVLTREEMMKNQKEPKRDLSGLSVGLGKYFQYTHIY